MAALTKPCLNSSSYKICIYTFPQVYRSLGCNPVYTIGAFSKKNKTQMDNPAVKSFYNISEF